MFRISTLTVSLLDSGPAGTVICAGLTVTSDCTVAMAKTLIGCAFVERLSTVIRAWLVPGASGGTVLIIRSKFFPGVLVFNSATKFDWLLVGDASCSGSSSLLMMCTTALVSSLASGAILIDTYAGFTSTGLKTMPLRWTWTTGWLLSLQVTDGDRTIGPPKPVLSN